MKVVIVMTYFDRQFQLERTLKSISKTEHDDFEVIIVDDCSKTSPNIAGYDFSIDLYKTKNKRWIDGSPAYNLGILKALDKNPDVIMLQCAETYHVGDIIKYATTVTDKNYISFACYNLSKEFTFKDHDLSWLLKYRNAPACDNEGDAWLNHSTIRQIGFNWCSVITADNMRKLNGFDERFCDGYCCEDVEFLVRIRMLNLNVQIIDYPFVVHQWHERNYRPENWRELWEVNKRMVEQVRRENSPVAIHKFTKNFGYV